MRHVWERRETHTSFWWEDLKGGHHLDAGIDGRIILE
jgi:hypothetical protein